MSFCSTSRESRSFLRDNLFIKEDCNLSNISDMPFARGGRACLNTLHALTCVRLVVAIRFPPWSWNTLSSGRGSPLPDLTRSRCSSTLESAESRVVPVCSSSTRSVILASISRSLSSSFSSCVGSLGSAAPAFSDWILTSSFSFASMLDRDGISHPQGERGFIPRVPRTEAWARARTRPCAF